MGYFPVITTRYPAGAITPWGESHLLRGDLPMVAWRAYDDTEVFNLLGPLALWDTTQPEAIRLLELKGLIPPWQMIEQKGATQDGSTFVTSLYDPLEVELTVQARGRDAAYTRKVVRDWYASWDAKQPGTLSWFTPELGYWWAKMRWAKSPLDNYIGGTFTRQKISMVGKCHDAFWRSYDTTDVFAYSYLSDTELFTTDYSGDHDLGDGWTIAYSGSGSGYIYADGLQATSTLTGGRYGVARHNAHVSATDTQIVTVTIGPIDPWPQATDVYLDIWARMNETGTPGLYGVRARFGYRADPAGWKGGTTSYTPTIELSYFVNGVQTILREVDVTVPWQTTDQLSLAVGGYAGKTYSYYIQRGTNTKGGTKNVTWATLLTYVQNAADGSTVGEDYRGAGFGLQSDTTYVTPSIVCWTAGDSTAAEESGYVELYNSGDQPMWPYFVLCGPGLFGIGDGPNATQAVTYGPLEQNQMVLMRTDPRRYGIVDLTSMPPPGYPVSSQYFSALEAALAQYNAFLTNGSAGPHLSPFGIEFPQGNPYSLMTGRFSRPIPAKSPGKAVEPAPIAVAVEGGGPTTAILAGGTPLRRYPE